MDRQRSIYKEREIDTETIFHVSIHTHIHIHIYTYIYLLDTPDSYISSS